VCGTNTACAALMIDGSVLALFSYTFMLLLQFIHTSVLYLLVLVLVLVFFLFFLLFCPILPFVLGSTWDFLFVVVFLCSW
jgi:hypothetical protein